MDSVNERDLSWTRTSHGKVNFKRKQLGEAAGSQDLGLSLYELESQQSSWPFHYHTGNEEAIYVLEGNGLLRLGEEEHSIEKGDYVALLPDEDHAHQVVNESDQLLRYIVISTMNHPDVTVYPDSQKVGIFTGSAPGRKEGRNLTEYFPEAAAVSYWSGEN